jgi:capsular polysaccharide biosynthesis protein
MELNEALRRTVTGRWTLIVTLIILPVLVVAALGLAKPPTYSAVARVQASSTPPGSDTEADAVLSRVDGIATSSTVIDPALAKAKITDRNVGQITPEIGVNRLGTSAVFDISVTDQDPHVAVALATAVAQQLVAFLNGAGNPQPNLLLNQLTQQQTALRDQRTQLAASLALATNPVKVANLSAQLASVDQELTNVANSIQNIQSQTLSDSSAAVIATPSAAVAAPDKTATNMALAGLAGLIVALLITTITEVLRPRVADARAFARELGAPMLGRLNSLRQRARVGAIAQPEVRVALRRAVDHNGVTTVVLTGPSGQRRLSALADDLRDALAERIPSGPPQAQPQAPSRGGNGQLPTRPGERETRPGEREARAVTLAPARELPATEPAVRVLELSELDDETHGQRVGLVVVVPDLTPYAEVRRLNDLLATTGWPVIGVLGDPIRVRRRSL